MQVETVDQDILNIQETYTEASKGKRFANFLIDLVVFYAFVFFFALIAALVYPPLIEILDYEETLMANLLDRIISLIVFGLFMGTTEAIFKGKSIGKLITRTRAVNLDGSPISTKTAFLRGFSRMVPFEAFSALGDPPNPWHDRWTSSMVIEEPR